MIKLIASDLNGTIIDKDNQINKQNFTAIEKINKNGLNFVVCTGKTYLFAKDLCKNFNANYGIFGNGNQVIDLKTGKEIFKKFLTPYELITCIELANQKGLHIHIYTDNEIITEYLQYMDLRNYKLHENDASINFTIVPNIKSYIINNNISASQLVISTDFSIEPIKEQILAKLDVSINTIKKRGVYKDFIINKEYEYIDISAKQTNKNNALQFLLHHLKIKDSEIMAIGDNLNDYEMVKSSGIGIALANSYDELKKVATYITKNPVEKGGFAEAINKFL